MPRRQFLLTTGLALLLPLAGCGSTRSTAPPAGSAVLVLANGSADPVRYVYLSPCAAGDWGADRLDADEVVMPGRSRSFALDPGCWDARAVFSDGRATEARGFQLGPERPQTWAVTM